MLLSSEQTKIEEMVDCLRRKRPDDRVRYQDQADGLHIAFVDSRGRRYVMVISSELMAWIPGRIVERLDEFNWQLVMGVSVLRLQGKVIPHFHRNEVLLLARNQ